MPKPEAGKKNTVRTGKTPQMIRDSIFYKEEYIWIQSASFLKSSFVKFLFDA